jgi:hypothetical protein
MTVHVQRLCNTRIERNIANGVRFESVRITIRNSFAALGSEDFRKYVEICTQLFPPSEPETNILAEIIHTGIETMHMLAQMDKDKQEAKE